MASEDTAEHEEFYPQAAVKEPQPQFLTDIGIR